ncbi:hypothetical protein PoB_004929100 [Plakobranchus ocellatus]|uniref:Uncharacterized protein n=1 Tax=Plakobranchus ocellatus TaxID=259542 RepID=A0AAV4BUR0_9GAST|nr:hypothetical protein PoB_004929100 [Plakobranchus ocellatus]
MDRGERSSVTSRRVVRDVKFKTSRMTSAPVSPKAENSVFREPKDWQTINREYTYKKQHIEVQEPKEISKWRGFVDKGVVVTTENGPVVEANGTREANQLGDEKNNLCDGRVRLVVVESLQVNISLLINMV